MNIEPRTSERVLLVAYIGGQEVRGLERDLEATYDIAPTIRRHYQALTADWQSDIFTFRIFPGCASWFRTGRLSFQQFCSLPILRRRLPPLVSVPLRTPVSDSSAPLLHLPPVFAMSPFFRGCAG